MLTFILQYRVFVVTSHLTLFGSPKFTSAVDFCDSREALTILDSIASTIQRGVHENKLQHTPHIVLLDRDFYNHELKPLLVRWQLLYLRSKRLPNIEDRVSLASNLNVVSSFAGPIAVSK